jgi:hypothetical protein
MKIADILIESKIDQFNRWFNHSKMVDANGRPVIFYHGSTRSFSKFDPSHDVRGNGLIFFTPDREAAEMFGANIISAYLRITNLFDAYSNFPNNIQNWIRKNQNVIAHEILDYKNDFGLANHSYIEDTTDSFNVDNYISAIKSGEWQSLEASRSLIQHIKNSGFDGIKFYEDGDTYAVFDDSQIWRVPNKS